MPRGFAGGQGKRPGGPRGLLPLCFRVSRVEPQAATRSSRSSWISAEHRIVSYHEHDHQVDLIADMAVASFGFEMIYEREGSGFRARPGSLGLCPAGRGMAGLLEDNARSPRGAGLGLSLRSAGTAEENQKPEATSRGSGLRPDGSPSSW